MTRIQGAGNGNDQLCLGLSVEVSTSMLAESPADCRRFEFRQRIGPPSDQVTRSYLLASSWAQTFPMSRLPRSPPPSRCGRSISITSAPASQPRSPSQPSGHPRSSRARPAPQPRSGPASPTTEVNAPSPRICAPRRSASWPVCDDLPVDPSQRAVPACVRASTGRPQTSRLNLFASRERR
jgi:hypothetical protein